jgi:hypothetical protein
MDRSSRPSNRQRNFRINQYQDQMDLTDSYRIFHPAAAQKSFFSEILIFSPK